MNYRILEIRWKDDPRRFNRKMLFSEEGDLESLGLILLEILGTQSEHDFMFETKITENGKKNQYHGYVPSEWFKDDEALEGDEKYEDVLLKDVHLNSRNVFTFIYDMNCDYEFEIKVFKRSVTRDSDRLAFVLDGKGEQIWEDDIDALWAFLGGEKLEEDEMPWDYVPGTVEGFVSGFNVGKADKAIEQARIEENGFNTATGRYIRRKA